MPLADDYAFLGAVVVRSARVTLGWGGPWTARAAIEGPTLPSLAPRAAELSLGGAVYRGTVIPGEGGSNVDTASLRILGGAAGWRRPINPLGYVSDGGVLASTVVRDAAAEAGELAELVAGIDPQSPSALDLVLGVAFLHIGGRPASEVLERIAPGRWRVDPDGTTRIGARRRPTLARGSYEVLKWWPDQRRAMLVAEALTPIVPGAIVLPDGPMRVPGTIAAAEIVVTERRTRIYAYMGLDP